MNLLLRDFVEPPRPKASTWTRAKGRRRRALYISSPIGLGHARRDVAIAKELRQLVPGLEIDWLAQDPVTRVLEAEGERIHPLSAELANESSHMESESAEHDLHCFHAWRRMDEILIANFMVFHDLVREHDYDLWIGDEAWELDYYLHENPEQKRAAYVWLTDFVGWLPMQDGGGRESHLTADYNAEMIEHIERFPRVRDRALFVGNRDDVVQESFGAELPMIGDWTEEHFDFTGYITGFDPGEFADRTRLRAELGYGDDERVCLVTVGGSGVGGHLLRRVIAAFPEAKQRVPDLRMIVVCGPRIDPVSLPDAPGLEVVTYVHDLYRHLAACDLAVVQGGLTTSMELTAAGRPFLYFPLRHHFEQNFHVRHRLERYGAGRCMDFDESTPELIAEAISEEIGRRTDYRPVEIDGASACRGPDRRAALSLMPDVYAAITEADPAVVERIGEILELRAADEQQRAMREHYLAEIAFPDQARVLEVGCGQGPVARALASWPGVGEVVGVDPSPIFVEKARELAAEPANLSFIEGDARALPADDGSFDVAIFHTTLCHVPRPELALAEAARVLRPGAGWPSSTAITRPPPAPRATTTRCRRASTRGWRPRCTIAGSCGGCRSSPQPPVSSAWACAATATSRRRPAATC